MRQLAHGATRGCLCTAATSMFIKQPDNQERLNQQRRSNQHDFPTVSLPCGGFAEPDFALRTQSSLADVPALKLSPVENWLGNVDLGDSFNAGTSARLDCLRRAK